MAAAVTTTPVTARNKDKRHVIGLEGGEGEGEHATKLMEGRGIALIREPGRRACLRGEVMEAGPGGGGVISHYFFTSFRIFGEAGRRGRGYLMLFCWGGE